MEAALADNAIAHIYNLFPQFRDMEKRMVMAPNYPMFGRKNNIKAITKAAEAIETAGLSWLINTIDLSQLDQQSDKALAEILFKVLYIKKYTSHRISEIYSGVMNIWTNPEEMLTIGKDLPLLTREGRRIVIRDEQGHNAFLAIEGLAER